MSPLFGSIPSPSSGNLGPFHLYGVILAVGVLVAVSVAEQRWRHRGYPRDGIYDISFWVVIWGVIGARLYHVITDYELFEHDPWRAFQIWRGGLGIWGAVIGGAIAVVVITHRRKMPTLAVMDCMAPGIVLAQAIGRIGNYFNQELFGKPSTLPWALKISPDHRPSGYASHATFQPTFLYEIIWNLGLAGFLIWLGYRRRIKPPGLMALYVAGYAAFRLFEENLRIDYSVHVLGMRLNFWIALLVCLAGLFWFAWIQRSGKTEPLPLDGPRTDARDVMRRKST